MAVKYRYICSDGYAACSRTLDTAIHEMTCQMIGADCLHGYVETLDHKIVAHVVLNRTEES